MAKLMRYRGAIRKTAYAIQKAEPALVAFDRYFLVMFACFSIGLVMGISWAKGYY